MFSVPLIVNFKIIGYYPVNMGVPHEKKKQFHFAKNVPLTFKGTNLLGPLYFYPSVDPCLNNPCKNNGTCYVDAGKNYSFFCVCPIPKAYTGQDCGTPGKIECTTSNVKKNPNY